jgi:hypothetical protein
MEKTDLMEIPDTGILWHEHVMLIAAFFIVLVIIKIIRK